jgi:Uma2 family endonuclease
MPDPANRTLRRLADDLLEEHHVEYIDDGALMITIPTWFTHGEICERIRKSLFRARYTGRSSVDWDLSGGNFQFDLVDDPQKFFIPDLAVAYPGSTSNADFRANLAMVVEVTSPSSPKTVKNDHDIKPKQYAKAGIRCYLLVDQAKGTWTLFALSDAVPGYQVHSSGWYGMPIELPEPFEFTLPTHEWPAYQEE